MEFQMMKRRQLQSLCKLNNLPANLTNAAMAQSLSLLPIVEGLDELLRDPAASEPGSPESSVISTPAPSRTSTRVKPTKEDTQGSVLATRTRYGTRSRAVEGTDTRMTTATRTTRNKASQKQAETDLQAAFEADMEQSQVNDNILPGELQEISEAFSGISMNQSENLDVDNHAQEVVHGYQQEDTEMSNNNQKVDFHSLVRRDLQSLCKKNKIPANTSNATMADALESLEIVDGLEEFLEDYDSQAPRSPTMSEMTSSCARKTWTNRRITKEPTSSKLVTKSCRQSRKTVVEDIVSETNSGESKMSLIEAVGLESNSGESKLSVIEAIEMEKPEVVATVPETTMSEMNISEEFENQCETHIDESQLSVIDVAVMEKPEVVVVSDTSSCDETKQLEELEIEKDARTGGSEVLEQLEKVPSAYEVEKLEGLEIEGSDIAENCKQLEEMEIEKDAHTGGSEVIEQLEMVTSAGESDDTVDESTTTEGSVSKVPSDAGSDLGLAKTVEGAQEDDQMSEDTGSLNGSENSDFQNVDEVTTTAGADIEVSSAAGSDLCLVKKLVDAQEDDRKCENFDTEVTTMADQPLVFGNNAETVLKTSPAMELDMPTSDMAVLLDHVMRIESKTPLDKKSLRKLRKLYKERLQETTSLAKKLSSLTLEENAVTLAKVEENEEEENEETEGVSHASFAGMKSGDAPVVEHLIKSSNAPGSELLDNMVSEDAAVTVKVEFESEKNLNITPSKTAVSVGRMNDGSNVNKENMDLSSNGTPNAKSPYARSGNFLSDMSIGNLKKAIQNQSEKKRTALHPLASP